jgi:hypothetical protein
MTIMNKQVKFFIFFYSFIFTSCQFANAQEDPAGVFLEPVVTYELGETDVNYPAPISNSSGNADGFGLGLRVGLHVYETFFVGLDGRYSMPKFKDSGVSYNSDSKTYNWGPVIGMQMPDLGLRFWGTYVIDGGMDPDASGNLDVRFKDGRGFRLGAGFRLAAVSLNIEYQEVKYGQTDLEQIGPFAPGVDVGGVDLENKSWIASVSFPVEFK